MLQFKNFFVLMVSAGNDTTRYTMAAGIRALAERPELLETTQDDRIGISKKIGSHELREQLRTLMQRFSVPSRRSRRRRPRMSD